MPEMRKRVKGLLNAWRTLKGLVAENLTDLCCLSHLKCFGIKFFSIVLFFSLQVLSYYSTLTLCLVYFLECSL